MIHSYLLVLAACVALGLACCAPNVFTAQHSATFVGAVFPKQGGGQWTPATSALGMVYRDSTNTRIAFNDTVLYADPETQGTLVPVTAYVVGLFASSRFAVIFNGSTCLQTTLNSSVTLPPDCFTTFEASIMVGSEKLLVATQGWSDPGHLTVQRVSTVTSSSVCQVVSNKWTFLNGNLSPLAVGTQNLWNVTVVPSLPNALFSIPSNCRQVPPDHPALQYHWFTRMLTVV
jgi:hypothetical protein